MVAGPVPSRRFGNALGIDLGSKDQTLAVSRDNRMPRASVVVTTAARQMIRLSKAGEKVDGVVVYGSEVDPTLHPKFREITENLRDLRNKWFPRAKFILLSNEPHLEGPEVRHSLAIYGSPIIRLEGGTSKSFAQLTGRKANELTSIVQGLSNVENLVVAGRILRAPVDLTSQGEIRGWIKRLGELKLAEVQLLGAGPKVPKGFRFATKQVIERLAAEIDEKLGVSATVHEDLDLFSEHAAAV